MDDQISVSASSVASSRVSTKRKKTTFKKEVERIHSPVKKDDHLRYLQQISQKRKNDPLGLDMDDAELKERQYDKVHTLDFDNLNVDFDEFYQEKVQSFPQERQFFDYYLSMVEPKKDEGHQLIWFNRNIIDEIQQNEIEQKEILNKMEIIRQEIATLEKDIFYEQEQKRIRLERIQSLETLGRPVEEDITYIIPEKFSKTSQTIHSLSRKASPPEDVRQSIASPTNSLAAAKKANKPKSSAFTKIAKTGEILIVEKKLETETRKIYSLLQEIETKADALLSEKHHLEDQFLHVCEEEFQLSTDCLEKVKETEGHAYHLIQEFLSLKYRIWIAQREEMEALEALVSERQFFQQKQRELKEKVPLIHFFLSFSPH